MLATSNFGSSSSQPHNFLPNIPSPLSPRRADVQNPSFWSFHNPMAASTSQHGPAQTSNTPFSSRPIKVAPVPRSDALRERRRDMFLRKVRQSRDDSKWDSRIDDMARLDYLNEKRRWEAEQARSAPTTYSDLLDAEEEPVEYDLPTYSSQMQLDARSRASLPSDQEIDALSQREDQELEALLAMMQEEERRQNQQLENHEEIHDHSSSFGSDDDEYDNIFMNLIDENGGTASEPEQQHPQHMDDEMDLS